MAVKVWVRWTEGKSGMVGIKPPVMWIGGCEGCDHTTQYWSWGASLGHMLEHQWIGCEGEKKRARDRRAKYAASQARLSCGGRAHGIMGEERAGSVVRYTEMPSSVPDVSRPISQANTGQATLERMVNDALCPICEKRPANSSNRTDARGRKWCDECQNEFDSIDWEEVQNGSTS